MLYIFGQVLLGFVAHGQLAVVKCASDALFLQDKTSLSLLVMVLMP